MWHLGSFSSMLIHLSIALAKNIFQVGDSAYDSLILKKSLRVDSRGEVSSA